MGTKEVRCKIENLCKLYNVKYEIFVVSYGEKLNPKYNRIRNTISDNLQYIPGKTKYAIKYIESYRRYIVWDMEKSGTTQLSLGYDKFLSNLEDNKIVTKNIGYSGYGKEPVSILDESGMVNFIKSINK